MTHDEMIEVIAAHRNGKKIQKGLQYAIKNAAPFEDSFKLDWQECCNPLWAFDRSVYRVKPEPPHCYGHIYEDGSFGFSTFIDRQSAEEHPYDSKMQVVKLILAPDEEQP